MVRGTVAVCCLLVALVVVVQAGEVPDTASKVTCDLLQLEVCQDALNGKLPPPAECCEKLKEQESCFCDYLKNPLLRPYIDSPNAKKVAAACSITPPNCSSLLH